MSFKFKILVINVLVVIFLVVDRLFKIYFKKFSDGELFIFKDWVKLKLATNPGIAFGLPVNFSLLIFLYAIILVVLMWLLAGSYMKKNYLTVAGYSLILVGAWSNLVDRIFYGHVIDYIDVKYYSVLNVADIMIFCGVALIIAFSFLQNKKH